MPLPGPGWRALWCAAVALGLLGGCAGRERAQPATNGDVAGPVVRAQLEKAVKALAAPPSGLLGDANSTEEKKKTIAQILDEALEHEFPEAKDQGVGKNYNESAKLDDVRAQPSHTAGYPCGDGSSANGQDAASTATVRLAQRVPSGRQHLTRLDMC